MSEVRVLHLPKYILGTTYLGLGSLQSCLLLPLCGFIVMSSTKVLCQDFWKTYLLEAFHFDFLQVDFGSWMSSDHMHRDKTYDTTSLSWYYYPSSVNICCLAHKAQSLIYLLSIWYCNTCAVTIEAVSFYHVKKLQVINHQYILCLSPVSLSVSPVSLLMQIRSLCQTLMLEPWRTGVWSHTERQLCSMMRRSHPTPTNRGLLPSSLMSWLTWLDLNTANSHTSTQKLLLLLQLDIGCKNYFYNDNRILISYMASTFAILSSSTHMAP